MNKFVLDFSNYLTESMYTQVKDYSDFRAECEAYIINKLGLTPQKKISFFVTEFQRDENEYFNDDSEIDEHSLKFRTFKGRDGNKYAFVDFSNEQSNTISLIYNKKKTNYNRDILPLLRASLTVSDKIYTRELTLTAASMLRMAENIKTFIRRNSDEEAQDDKGYTTTHFNRPGQYGVNVPGEITLNQYLDKVFPEDDYSVASFTIVEHATKTNREELVLKNIINLKGAIELREWGFEIRRVDAGQFVTTDSIEFELSSDDVSYSNNSSYKKPVKAKLILGYSLHSNGKIYKKSFVGNNEYLGTINKIDANVENFSQNSIIPYSKYPEALRKILEDFEKFRTSTMEQHGIQPYRIDLHKRDLGKTINDLW